MARFQKELPTQIMNDFKKIYDDADKIFGAMTKAGAEVAMQAMKNNVPLSDMAEHIHLTRTYKTPTDDGINTKVYFSGYLPFSGNRTTFSRRGRSGGDVYTTNKGVPVSFLAQIYEYGRSTSPFPKRPFMRKSFSKAKIEKAMLEAQKKASGGLLE